MELIPGLPNDVARDCLIRVMYNQFGTAVSVCKDWKTEILSPEFRRYRKETGCSQRVVVMSQAQVNKNESSSTAKYHRVSPVYRLTVLEPSTGAWCELPPVPEYSNGLPMFCQVVGVGSDLVVLGGLDPVTWDVSNLVFVYDFVSATWRRGADMPGVRRSFFGCVASGSDRVVFVAGGHDGEKNALRSAMAYDVAHDEWVMLPDMANERDECKAVFHGGKLHVIGGYRTDMQGRFERSADVFDIATWQWEQGQEGLLGSAMCPRTCASGDGVELYMCHDTDVVARKGNTWQTIAKLPAEVAHTAYVATSNGKLLVIGSARFGEPHTTCVMDLETRKWSEIKSPGQYSGHVQSGCFLEM